MRTELRVPAAAHLLDTWESGLDSDPPRQAQLLLEALCSDSAPVDLSQLSVGQRNRLLLRARMLLFGIVCDTLADCPACGAELEAAVPVPALIAGDEHTEITSGEVVEGEYLVRYRVPIAADLIGVAARSVDDAARELMAGCVLSVQSGGRELPWTELPDQVTRLVEEAVAQADPDAVLDVGLTCPSCGETVTLPLDPASFLWGEVDGWAGRTLREVHQLATAYGWEERTILAMSPRRRRMYVAMTDAAGTSR